MANLFTLLLLLSLVLLVAGLLKPSVYDKYVKGLNRKKIALIFGGSAIACFVLVGVTGSADSNKQATIAQPMPAVVKKVTTPVATPKTTVGQIKDAVKAAGLAIFDSSDIQYDSSTKKASLTFVNDNFWDEKALVQDGFIGFANFGRQAFRVDGVDNIDVQEKSTTTDSHGNKVQTLAIDISMDKTAFSTFNWDNLKNHSIYNGVVGSSSNYYIEPTLVGKFTADQIFYY